MQLKRTVGVVSLSVVFFPLAARHAGAEVLFSDNFEITTNGGNDTDSTNATAPLPVLAADIGKYSDPNTNGRIGAYGAALLNPTPAGVNASMPAAPTGGGSHGLRLQPPPNSGSRVVGFLSQPASVPGSAFRFEFDLYATNNINFGFGSQNRVPFEGSATFGLASPGKDRPRMSMQANIVAIAGSNPAASNVNIFKDHDTDPSTNNAQVASGLTIVQNVYTHVIVDYVIGASTFTLTVGAQPAVEITSPWLSAIDNDFDSATTPNTPQAGVAPSQVDAIFFGSGSNGSVGYVDNIVVTGIAFAGDANHDLKVNTLDFNALASYFGAASNASWQEGDFNADNKIDSTDFGLLVGNFGATYTPPAGPALGSVVPEPASLGILAIAALFTRRSRRMNCSA
jgi:hypothetical protein